MGGDQARPESSRVRTGLGGLKCRTLFELLLAAVLVAGAYYLFIYVPKHAKPGEPVVALSNYFLTYAPIERVHGSAYVLPDTLDLWDTPAEIRNEVGKLNSGEEVRVLGRFRDWAHVREAGGREGWVSTDGLMDSQTHQAEDRLFAAMSELPAQAAGEAAETENLHIQPSRAAAIVREVNPDEKLEILQRKLVRRTVESYPLDIGPATTSRLEVWYLVREATHAGWILGHRVHLTIPSGISAYAQDANLVAWLTLNKVQDNGHPVPQYVVADRIGTEACDFTEIQVLTWWKREQTYAVAFRQGGFQGYFPILVTHEGSVPYIRLRVVGPGGKNYQVIYGLFDTLTRLVGIADTWASDAPPESPTVQFFKRKSNTTSLAAGGS